MSWRRAITLVTRLLAEVVFLSSDGNPQKTRNSGSELVGLGP